ncbi:MAG: caspase family protein [Betaproteobacteria bacterium]|nr:caspase family protein [Betaproteobacteria bacterium]
MLRVLAAVFLLFSAPSLKAQPQEGALLSGVIALGSGRSVPLPEGQWKLVAVRQQLGERRNPPNLNRWTGYFLRNLDEAALMPMMAVYTGQATGSFWSNSVCRLPNNTLLLNQYGTLPTALENRCSGLRAVNAAAMSEFWRSYYEYDLDIGELSGRRQDALNVALLKVFKLRDGLEMEIFIRQPVGSSARKLREEVRADADAPSAVALHGWMASYIERLDKSYLGKQPQEYPLLSFDAAADRFTRVAEAPAADAERAREQLRREIAAREDERRAREQERQALEARAREQERQAAQARVLEQERLASEARAREQERLAAEARAREQERLAAEARVREQARLAAEARTREEQRQAAEARAREQERLAAEARAREQERLAAEARMREQERLAAEARNREQERLAAEARAREEAARVARQRDAELARLREQLAQLEAQKASAQAATPSAPAAAARRALVIGNDSYAQVARLNNAREDARAMAASLQSLGYQVTLRLDLREREMKQALRVFKAQVEGGDEVVFFYAGHGVQLGGSNYLLPVDIAGESEDQIRDEAIQLQRLLDDMSEKKARFTLALLDACRDNPFKTAGRSLGGRGLAPTSAATGQMVIFSAGAGQQALDRLGPNDKDPNGLFTRVFLREMHKPGLSVDRVVRSVRTEVVNLARSVGHEQVPAIYDQVVGEFFFRH